MEDITLLFGKAEEKLKGLADDSVDSIVTDPPSGIEFMGKAWDSFESLLHFQDFICEVFTEAKRVLKPGGYALVWAIPRTAHHTAMGLERAGFEIRDKVYHLFGSGFPKNLDVSKALDKRAGAKRKVIGVNKGGGMAINSPGGVFRDDNWTPKTKDLPITEAQTEEAKQWEGWGTALKPAAEEWILCRKPLGEKTVAENVLKYATGGINIDESRVPFLNEEDYQSATFGQQTDIKGGKYNTNNPSKGNIHAENVEANRKGRYPSHVVLTCNCEGSTHDEDCPVRMIDEQAPDTGAFAKVKAGQNGKSKNVYGDYAQKGDDGLTFYNDFGGASRFFYCAKPTKTEKDSGLKDRANNHPTVKSVTLMKYFIKMITPPGGVVLDMFGGSGTTIVATIFSGMKGIYIDDDENSYKIAKARTTWAKREYTPKLW